MKVKEIRAKKPEELQKSLVEMKSELIKLKAQVAMGTTPKSPKQIKAIRKTIARINTIAHEKTNGEKTK